MQKQEQRAYHVDTQGHARTSFARKYAEKVSTHQHSHTFQAPTAVALM